MDHCQIISDSMDAKRAVDGTTYEALEVLSERLQRMQQLGGAYSRIGFSSHVKKLAKRERALTIG